MSRIRKLLSIAFKDLSLSDRPSPCSATDMIKYVTEESRSYGSGYRRVRRRLKRSRDIQLSKEQVRQIMREHELSVTPNLANRIQSGSVFVAFILSLGSLIIAAGSFLVSFVNLAPHYDSDITCKSGHFVVTITQKGGVHREPYVEIYPRNGNSGQHEIRRVLRSDHIRDAYEATIPFEINGRSMESVMIRVVPYEYAYPWLVELLPDVRRSKERLECAS